MIDYLKGKIVHRELDYLVIETGGIGYRVFCPNAHAFSPSEETTIYTHHHVREDAALLFGFGTRHEQSLFRKLIEVSGIGPKMALGMLAKSTPEHIIGAIQQENVTFLTKLPGVGKKTGQRLILDLKEKLPSVDTTIELPQAYIQANDTVKGWQEAKEGLQAMGFTEQEIGRVREECIKSVSDSNDTQSLMKKALTLLYRG